MGHAGDKLRPIGKHIAEFELIRHDGVRSGRTLGARQAQGRCAEWVGNTFPPPKASSDRSNRTLFFLIPASASCRIAGGTSVMSETAVISAGDCLIAGKRGAQSNGEGETMSRTELFDQT